MSLFWCKFASTTQKNSNIAGLQIAEFLSTGSKVLLLGISYSPIACKIENDDQIMWKSVMFRHISRCVLYSGVWIAVFRS